MTALNHHMWVRLQKSLSVDGNPSVQLSADSWSHQRDFTATASYKNPKQWQEEGAASLQEMSHTQTSSSRIH